MHCVKRVFSVGIIRSHVLKNSQRFFPAHQIALQYRQFVTQKPIKTTTQTGDRAITKKKKGIRDIGGEPPSSLGGPLSAPSLESSQAIGFCTAENYSFSILLPMLKGRYQVLPLVADGIIHLKMVTPPVLRDETTEENDVENDNETDTAPEAFIFNDGTLVTWGATLEQNDRLLDDVKKSEVNPYHSVETERFDYYMDPSQNGGISADTIILGYDVPPTQAKLAFSSGMARSVKLGSLEDLLDTHLNKTRSIPQALLSGKALPLGRATVLRHLGELFSLRGHVNLHSELLDSPEFCWSNGKMEEYFDKISKNLDVKPRIAIFNKKLDYANQVAEALRSHLHEEHSLKLEWFIIILIGVEIGFEVLHYVERFGLIEIPDHRNSYVASS